MFGNGLNLTFAAGMQEDEGTGAGQRDTFFTYGKAGWIFDVSNGVTPQSPLTLPYVANEARGGDDAWAYGGFLVQKIDWVGTELYAGVRVYDVEHFAPVLVAGTNFGAVASADPGSIIAVMTGARVKF